MDKPSRGLLHLWPQGGFTLALAKHRQASLGFYGSPNHISATEPTARRQGRRE